MKLTFNPEMLSLARDLRGMKQQELAEKANLTQGTISKYIGGSQTPSDDDVERLADALGVPVSFLYRSGNRCGTLDGHIFHRQKTKASPIDERRIDALLEEFRLEAHGLLSGVDVEAQYSVPELSLADYDGDVELVAEAVRTFWKMPRGPVNNVTQQLEAAGCLIYASDFGTDDIDENVQWIAPTPPIILVNTRAPGDRLRFSLAHALGHILMHRNESPHPEREKEANRFASAFLMPAEDIRDFIHPVTLEHLLELKPLWKVSVAAMIYRAHDLGEITDRRKTSLFQMISRAGWRKTEPEPIKVEQPKFVHNLLRIYREQLSYGDKDFAKKFSLFPEDFRRMYYPYSPDIRILDTK